MRARCNDRGMESKRPVRSPRRALWPMAMACIVTLAAPCPAWAADLLDSLYGRWTTGQPAPFTMTWTRERDGFAVRWTVPGGREADIHFTPTRRPGVFAGRTNQGWSMFGRDKPVNPLVEGTLYWARSTPDAVYVYSLSVDDRGAFVLDRYACRRAGQGRLDVALQRRLPDGKTEEMTMQLAKAGP